MPTSVAKGWIQEGGEGPLLTRWRQAGDKLAALGGQILVPCSEPNLNTMLATIRDLEQRRAVAAAPVIDEHVRAARGEFTDAVYQYHLLYKDVAEMQRSIRAFNSDPVYRLLFPDLRALLRELQPTQALLDSKYDGKPDHTDLYHLRKPVFHSVGEYRQATAWINDQIFALRNLQTDMAAVTWIPNEEINARLHRIAKALAKRVEDLERETIRSTALLRQLQTQAADALGKRLDQIEAQISRVAATARYVRATRRSK
jgi:hypothetical protein